MSLFIFKRPQPNLSVIKKCLVIALSRIGDAVYMTPVIREFKKNYPYVTLDLLCSPYNGAVFAHNPHISTFYHYKKGFKNLFHLKKDLQNQNYDIIIDLTSDSKPLGALLAFLAKSNYTIGFDNKKRGFCLDRSIPLPIHKCHMTDLYLTLLKTLQRKEYNNLPEISLLMSEKKYINDFLNTYTISLQEQIIGIHPGANFTSQKLPIEKWAQLGDYIQNKLHCKVILFGGKNDQEDILSIQKSMKSTCITLKPTLNLRESMALINRCTILLCNNSGPLHIAEALQTATLSWMGPTILYRWHPLGDFHKVIRKDVDCSPCNKGFCDHHTCAKLIEPHELIDEFTKLYQFLVRKKK